MGRWGVSEVGTSCLTAVRASCCQCCHHHHHHHVLLPLPPPPPQDVAEACGLMEGGTKIPHYQAYVAGELVDVSRRADVL